MGLRLIDSAPTHSASAARPEQQRIRRLADDLDARSADALHQMRRHLGRYAGIQTDVARQQEGVEARLRHRAGDHGADVGRRRTPERANTSRAALMPRSMGEISPKVCA